MCVYAQTHSQQSMTETIMPSVILSTTGYVAVAVICNYLYCALCLSPTLRKHLSRLWYLFPGGQNHTLFLKGLGPLSSCLDLVVWELYCLCRSKKKKSSRLLIYFMPRNNLKQKFTWVVCGGLNEHGSHILIYWNT